MTKQYGLNKYKSNTRTQFGFRNFQWVLEGVLARSSQPNYRNTDEDHDMGPHSVQFLKFNKIGAVISANHCDLKHASQVALGNAGIQYHHYRVGDYQPPTRFHLLNAADVIEANRAKGRATLVYCGYGEGRTGTFVSGWAMQKHIPQQAGANVANLCDHMFLKDFFGVETGAQALAVRDAAGIAAPAPPAYPPGLGFQAGASGASVNSFTGPNASGPSGLGLPADNNLGLGFANFNGSGGSSWS
jgi:protein-tyrosine phosphatase